MADTPHTERDPDTPDFFEEATPEPSKADEVKLTVRLPVDVHLSYRKLLLEERISLNRDVARMIRERIAAKSP